MSQNEHFSYGLLYSLSPEQMARMHIGEEVIASLESRVSNGPGSYAGYLISLLRKTLKRQA